MKIQLALMVALSFATSIGCSTPSSPSAEPVTAADPLPAEATWATNSAFVLSGRIVDQHGAPIARAKVWLQPFVPVLSRRFLSDSRDPDLRETETDDNGEFEYRGLAPGRWLVGLAPSATTLAQELVPAAVRVDVRQGEELAPVLVRADRGLRVSGRVVGADGTPVSGVDVIAHRADFDRCETETGADGTFVLGPLGAGEYGVFAGNDDDEHPLSSNVLYVSAGAAELVLTLAKTCSISGAITKPVGVTFEVAHVWLFMTGGRELGTYALEPDASGKFDEEDIDAGTYTLAACDAHGNAARPREITLAAGEALGDVEVELEPGTRLALRYDGSSPQGWFSIEQAGVPVAFVWFDADERPAEVSVPPGAIRITLKRMFGLDDAQPIVREVELTLGESRELVFTD